jgi:hypothetical protein
MANGTGLSIYHIGYGTVQTAFGLIHLTNVLHVPHITKNLLSTQLLKDNSLFIKFSPTHCFVKDQLTKKVLLHGTLTNGLYAVQTFT